MNTRLILFFLAGFLIVAGAISAAFLDGRGPEPELVCVPENTPSSGFADSDQGDCPVSDESYEEWAEWDRQGNPYLGIGIIAIVVGVGLGVTGVFIRPGRKS